MSLIPSDESIWERGDGSSKAGTFTSADKMRFTSLTYELIEELRLRRELDSENEKKIQRLLEDRFSAGWKLDQQTSQLSSLTEKHEAAVRETKHSLEEKMRELQIEASQHQVYRKLAEKEKEALKEEIKKLQLSNFSLEKKVRESEHHERIQASEREQHVRQVTRFETQHRTLQAMVKQLTDTLDRLDADMKRVQELNRKLVYQTGHQKTLVRMKNEAISQLKEDLLAANIRNKLDPQCVERERQQLQGQIASLGNRIKQTEEESQRLNEEKDEWKEKYWEGLRKLEESHRLVTVHLHNSSSYRDESRVAEEQRQTCQQQLDQTQADLGETGGLLEETQRKLEEGQATWAAEKSQVSDTVSEAACDMLEKTQTKLEEGEATWATERESLIAEMKAQTAELDQLSSDKAAIAEQLRRIEEAMEKLKAELQDALAILNVEKTVASTQTDLSMLKMTDCGLQVQPEISAVLELQMAQAKIVGPGKFELSRLDRILEMTDCGLQVQPEIYVMAVQTCVESRHLATQTIDPALSSVGVQAVPMEVTLVNAKTGETTDVCPATTQTEQCIKEEESQTDLWTPDVSPKMPSISQSHMATQTDPTVNYNIDDIIAAPCVETGATAATNTDYAIPTIEEGNNKGLLQNTFQDQLKANEIIYDKHSVHVSLKSERDTIIGDLEKKVSFTNGQTCNTEASSKKSDDLVEEESGIIQKDKTVQRIDFGIRPPSLNLEGLHDEAVKVVVDPDEFEVALTQDEVKALANTTADDSDTSAEEVMLIDDTEDENDTSLDAFVENCNDTVSKSKADKRKLTHQEVLDQFSNFDESREKFADSTKAVLGECTQSKIPKLSQHLSIHSNKPRVDKNDNPIISGRENMMKSNYQNTFPSISTRSEQTDYSHLGRKDRHLSSNISDRKIIQHPIPLVPSGLTQQRLIATANQPEQVKVAGEITRKPGSLDKQTLSRPVLLTTPETERNIHVENSNRKTERNDDVDNANNEIARNVQVDNANNKTGKNVQVEYPNKEIAGPYTKASYPSRFSRFFREDAEPSFGKNSDTDGADVSDAAACESCSEQDGHQMDLQEQDKHQMELPDSSKTSSSTADRFSHSRGLGHDTSVSSSRGVSSGEMIRSTEKAGGTPVTVERSLETIGSTVKGIKSGEAIAAAARKKQGETTCKTSGQTLLHNYQNIVASLKNQPERSKEPSITQRSTLSRDGPPRRPRQQVCTDVSDVGVGGKASSSGTSFIGILRGNTNNSKRSKSVSWNENVLQKDF